MKTRHQFVKPGIGAKQGHAATSKEKLIIIELPGFDFEEPHPNAEPIEPLFDKVRQFLDTKGVNRNEYARDSHLTAGFGELVLQKVNDFWLVCTTERGTIFDVAIFSNEFHAVNYFIFRLRKH